MRKFNKLAAVCMMVTVMTVGTSCSNTDMQVKIQQDGQSTFAKETLVSKEDLGVIKSAVYPSMEKAYGKEMAEEYMKQAFGEIEACDIVSVDGKEYYQNMDEISYNDMEELQSGLNEQLSSVGTPSVGTDHFYIATIVDETVTDNVTDTIDMTQIQGALDEAGITMEQIQNMVKNSKVSVTIEFPNNITYSNGQYEAGSNKVTWNFDANGFGGIESTNTNSKVKTLYAETMENSVLLNDKTAPKITGMKNKGYYRKGTFKVTDQVGVAGVQMNGMSLVDYSALLGTTGTTSKNTYSIADYAQKQGVQTVVAYDYAGNKTTLTYTYDTTKPVVKGVTNKKTYKKARTIKFSDKYGIKSAKLNGKTIKNNKKVSKKGSYTLKVTDKAGNVTTVKFKIKK